MEEPRPTPFALVFGSVAPERFPVLRAALETVGRDPVDRDGFLLVREVAELLHELRPEAGVGDAVQGLVAFLHYAYLFWRDGEHVRILSDAELAELLGAESGRRVVQTIPPADPTVPAFRPSDFPTSYAQLPALRVWGTPLPGGSAEPLDGWFARRTGAGLSILAVFGLHPAREGLTAVELAGPRPGSLRRLDGSELFAPTLAGGAAAGLASIAGEAELLELAWRAEELA